MTFVELKRTFVNLDIYGGSIANDPTRFPVTPEGAILSILSITACLAVVVTACIRISSGSYDIVIINREAVVQGAEPSSV